jgi:hypothetical protein
VSIAVLATAWFVVQLLVGRFSSLAKRPEAYACPTASSGWAPGSVSRRAIPHVALMRATCLEEAGGYCGGQPHAEDDQKEVAEDAEAAQSFRLRTAKAAMMRYTK